MKFSKKTAHRLLIFLGMFAPIAYLFGSMFFGLAGAHGEQIYKDDVIVQRNDYDYLMQNENFSYGAFDWENEHGQRIGFSLGSLMVESSTFELDFLISPDASGISVYYNTGAVTNCGLGFFGSIQENYASIIFDNGPDFYVDETTFTSSTYSYYWAFGFDMANGEKDIFVFTFVNGNNSFLWWNFDNGIVNHDTGTPEDFDFSMSFNMYFDDFSSFDVDSYALGSASASDMELLHSYIDMKIKPVQSDTYTASVFGQFFPRDNFLQKIGENALSEAPVGFAPFSAMFRYLDSSVFHGSNSEIALMLYGEVYWSLHVVMADLVYHVLVWIPNLVNRVFDWFDSKGLSDE